MKGKDFVEKVAREAVNNYYKLNPAVQAPSDGVGEWFFGTCASDFSTITDDEGNTYELSFYGNPQIRTRAYKTSLTTAVAVGPNFRAVHLYQNNNKGYLLYRDSLWFYICKLGSADKYYLPYCLSLKGRDVSGAQAMFSSDGKAVLIGTVLENLDSDFPTPPALIYHQIARYGIFPDIKLVAYTSEALQAAELSTSGLDYPVNIDSGNKIAWCDVTKIVDNAFNLNTESDGFVPAPDPSTYPAQSIFFPYSDSRSRFFAFGVPTRLEWDQDTGLQYYKTSFIPGASVDYYAQKETQADNQIKWSKTDNSSLFKSFRYVFNNDQNGEYNADLVSTFVNCYLAGLTEFTWDTSFTCNEQLVYNLSFGGLGLIVLQNDYNEQRRQTYSYTYQSDFAYTLQYFATPDIWLPPDVFGDLVDNTWVKNVHHFESNTLDGSSFEGSASYDAITNTYITTSGFYFDACQFAYRSTQTVGPPWRPFELEYYDVTDFTKASYYTGLQRTYKDYFNVAGTNFPGYYIHFPTIGNIAVFDYMDLNYDQLFPVAGATSYAIFSGRSSMVINNLAKTPRLYGIVSQLLGDGNDYNSLYFAFRGRSFVDNTNTAYVYKQDFNQVYRFSNPWLFQGNLSNIEGTGSAGIAESPNQDGYTDAIAQLVNWLSLADVYGDTALVSQISNLMETYRSQIIPSKDAVDSVVNNIIALDSNFTSEANRLRSQLYMVNDGLNGNSAIIGIDVIGYSPPDVFTDKVFATSATFPFQVAGSRYLKGIDSWVIQGYYIDENTEYIQNYNVSDGSDGTQVGFTTLGKKASGTAPTRSGQLYDYILPLAITETKG